MKISLYNIGQSQWVRLVSLGEGRGCGGGLYIYIYKCDTCAWTQNSVFSYILKPIYLGLLLTGDPFGVTCQRLRLVLHCCVLLCGAMLGLAMLCYLVSRLL